MFLCLTVTCKYYTSVTIHCSVTWVDVRLTQNCATYNDFASYICTQLVSASYLHGSYSYLVNLMCLLTALYVASYVCIVLYGTAQM